MVAADARTAITFALSPGQASDAVEGRKLLGGIGPLPAPLQLVMDGAHEDNQTLQLALDSVSSRWSRPDRIGWSPGNTIRPCTAGATKSSGYFAG
jgi:hypothetical protein